MAEHTPMGPHVEIVNTLRRLVRRNAVRWRWLIVLETLALAVAVALGFLWALFLIDNVLHLPVWGRVLAGGAFFTTVAWLGLRLARQWRQRLRISEDQVALAMERRTPGGAENRLINSLQLARVSNEAYAKVSPLVIQENYRILKQIELERAEESRPVVIRGCIALLVVGVGLGFWGLQPERFTNAATRILLPFANVAPIYDTVLTVHPGNIEVARGETVSIRIGIEREIPSHLTLMRTVGGERSSVRLPVEPGEREVSYTIGDIMQPVTYAVRGGDFASEHYVIQVPVPSQLEMVRAVMHYPSYTGRDPEPIQSTQGDFEALLGTRAEVTFVLDHPADQAELLLEKINTRGEGDEPADRQSGNGMTSQVERIALRQISETEYAGEIEFRDVLGYRLRTQRGHWEAYESPRYTLRMRADQPPTVRLSGLDRMADVEVGEIAALGIAAEDDYGLRDVGLFYRHVKSARLADDDRPRSAESDLPADWEAVNIWTVGDRARTFSTDHALPVATLGVAEGDRIEMVLRARDQDPGKGEAWTTGPVHMLRIGGEGFALQVLYERILASEAALEQLIASQREAVGPATQWMQKLQPNSDLRWDEQENIDALAEAMRELRARQEELREQSGEIAREMVAHADSLRISVGMLADTEMVRGIRVLESVTRRENPQEKRAALADARLVQERTIDSLERILEGYVRFRQDWELANMMPFTRMLAERQAAMADASARYGEMSSEESQLLIRSMRRRQEKMEELSGLAGAAFWGMSQRSDTVGPILADAFAEAARAFEGEALTAAMGEAADHAREGRWSEASRAQTEAAELLAAIYSNLQAAQAEAARQLVEQINQQQSDLLAQQEIEELVPGSSESMLDVDWDALSLEELVTMRKRAEEQKEKFEAAEEGRTFDLLFEESMLAGMQREDDGTRQEFDVLRLADTPSGVPSWPGFDDLESNMVSPIIQESFHDLVGDLLEEVETLSDAYETYNLNLAAALAEPGEVGKAAGPLSTTSAHAPTGNMAPPEHDYGGASRVGRQGARAHGAVVGDMSINRRGRDEALDGQERIADQEGTLQEVMSDDPQTDSSVGWGGKKIESDNPTSFNVKDKGTWSDEIIDRMDPGKEKHMIVERQGDPIDPRVAEMLRDLDDRQEQVVERIKAIRKEFDDLYLPTDHLDEMIDRLQANLDRLKEQPTAEVFRLQQQTLDELRRTGVIFQHAGSDFQPSLRREQRVRGRVLDETARPPVPGYEEAVKRYYELLAR